jgi:hypothetical protein
MAMATVGGGLFHLYPGSAAPTHVTQADRPDAGTLSLASATGGSGAPGSPFDTISGVAGDPRFAGTIQTGTDQVVATTTNAGGSTVFTLTDGSTLTFIGMVQPDVIIR